MLCSHFGSSPRLLLWWLQEVSMTAALVLKVAIGLLLSTWDCVMFAFIGWMFEFGGLRVPVEPLWGLIWASDVAWALAGSVYLFRRAPG